MEPRRRNRLVLLATLTVAAIFACLCGCPVFLFLRSPSPRLEGQLWTAEDAAYQLVDRGIVVDVQPAPGGALAVVVWDGQKGTVLIRRHDSAEAANQAAGVSGGYGWGHLTFDHHDGDPNCLDGVRAILH